MLRIVSAAVLVAAMQAPTTKPVRFSGWEFRGKDIKRPGTTWSDTLTRYSAKKGEEVVVVVMSFHDTKLAKEFTVKVRLLSPTGEEVGSLKEWSLFPAPEPGKSAEWSDQNLVFFVPAGSALKTIAFGDVSIDLSALPGATPPAKPATKP